MGINREKNPKQLQKIERLAPHMLSAQGLLTLHGLSACWGVSEIAN